MKKHLSKRLLSLLLAVVLCVGLLVPAAAAEPETADSQQQVSFEKVDNSEVTAVLEREQKQEVTQAPVPEEPAYLDTDMVRVSIVLFGKSTLERGYSTEDIAENDQAMAYRSALEQKQEAVEASLAAMLGELDVVWNLTLAANIISANVLYGQIAAIESHPSVQQVVIETCYEPAVVDDDLGADPNMGTSGTQIGRAEAYAAGYYGAGSRIAIIDTGTDTDHQSFDAGAFEYALQEDGGTYDLLDEAEIASVLEKLNASKRYADLTAGDLYRSSKLPFAFNYVDVDLNVSHLKDAKSEHGSHVAGIATANRYVPDGNGGYVNALEEVHVQGVAPDAQLITMKVFGINGGAYDSDYMVAIEDAILLGCDAINLSLGSATAGFARNDQYASILESLTDSDTVVVMSAGNNSYWAENSTYGTVYGLSYLYGDDVNYATGGSPGTYTNSLGVASVDNAGYTSEYVKIGDKAFFYTESQYSNDPISTLDTSGDGSGTEYEYVFYDNIGVNYVPVVDGDGNPVVDENDEPVTETVSLLDAELVKDKIVFVKRGTSSFVDKQLAAQEAGAVACIVYNSVPGSFGMNLSGGGTLPCVSISQEDAERIVGLSDAQDGYWTGTITVAGRVTSEIFDNDTYTMSTFSSWGVPGDLTLKPEITAPGGNIYSVNGTHYENGVGILGGKDAYENMSGTSMAAPQVTGMMALLAQYIKENNLKQEGLTVRALAQSLLMSTAEPMVDGESGSYYPVMQQGAGLANVGAAIAADSYILMGADATKSWADGKVKAELGDDPEKTGVYTFSFSINNLTGEEKCYSLSSELFTQDLFSYYGQLYLDTWTTSLQHTAVWTVNGVTLKPNASLAQYDFNGDREVNGEDCTALLDYVSGKRDSITNEALAAGLDGEDGVSTRDAYIFLTKMNEGAVSVPAHGSVKVQVTLTLTDEWLPYYVNGAYVEGYVSVTGLTTEEGVLGSTHTIPVLGFYGNWSDASMYEKWSLLDYWFDPYNENTDFPYSCTISSNGVIPNRYTNYLSVDYPGLGEYEFLGNPLEGLKISEDKTLWADAYLEDRNAVSDASVLTEMSFTSIRNAYAGKVTVTNADTGDEYLRKDLSQIYCAYYNENTATWENLSTSVKLNWAPENLADGTKVEVAVTLAPEYYVSADGTVAWDKLGDGATMSTSFTVDNTAPEMSGTRADYEQNEGMVTVAFRDNLYVAGVLLFAEDGDTLIDGQLVNQTEAGVSGEVKFDVSEREDDVYLVQVWDYAGNVSTYRLFYGALTETRDVTEVEISEDVTVVKGNSKQLFARANPKTLTDRSVTWFSSDPAIATVDENGLVTGVAVGVATITAASVLDPEKTATCNVQVIAIDVDLNGLVWDENGKIWWSSFNTSSLPDYTQDAYAGLDLASAAYGPDGTLYAASLDTSEGVSSLYTVNRDENGITTELVGDSSVAYFDLAYAPHLDCLFATYFNYVLLVDSETGEYFDVFDWCSNDLVGIAYCGSVLNSTYGWIDLFYLIDNTGAVYMEGFIQLGETYYYFNGEDEGFLGNTGHSVGTTPYFNSAYYDGNYLFWSAFDFDVQVAELYAIDVNKTGETFYLGQFADDVWPAGGLFQWTSDEDTETELDGTDARVAQFATATVKQVAVDSVEPVEIASPAPKGSLNSTVMLSQADASGKTRSGSVLNPYDDVITVELTAKDANGNDVASNNGLLTVTYDPETLTLVNVNSHAAYDSIVCKDGAVTIAYAQLKEIPAGASVATLTFRVNSYVADGVHVDYFETNDNLHVGYSEDLWADVDWDGDGEADPVLPFFPGISVGSGSSLTKPTEPMRFSDVSANDWFYDAVKYVYDEGLMNGTGDGKFSPYNTLTRAMVVTILYRLEGEPNTRYNGMFPDVPNYQWYTDAVEWAAKNSIVNGYDTGKFGPEDPVTREQLVTILYRYAQSKGYDVSASADLSAYSDGATVSAYAVNAVKWAVAKNLLEASNGKLQPRDAANRAQVALAVANFHKQYVK